MHAMEGTFDGLFKAKLRDNGVDYSEDDYKRFCAQLGRSFSKGVLDLSGQRIGINILTKLTKVLRTAPHIRVFNLYGNLIRDHGIHSLLQLLLSNGQVEVLDIGCNDFSNQAIPCIIDIVKSSNIKSLQLGATGVAWHNNKFSIQSLAELIAAIRASERIECLGLSGLKMSVRQGVRRISVVEELSDFIAEDEVLKSFSMSEVGFNLKEIDVITYRGLLANNRLKFLDIHNNSLADPVGPNFLGQLNHMSALTYLDLRTCQLSAESGKALASTLRNKNLISILNISDNLMGDEGISAIIDVLLTNTTLTELNISSNQFGEETAALIGSLIQQNEVLCALDMSKNPIGDNGAFAIAESLELNTSLTKISLASCRITDEGAVELSNSLAKNTQLAVFKINDNFLTRESGYRIIEAIKPNEHLFVYDVSATQIDHFVIKAIKELCKRNKQIQKEICLQPLKKQLVQLSIQRTKMPEAEMRLQNLENQRDQLEKEVINTEEELESTIISSDMNITSIRKTIANTLEMIEDEKKGIEKMNNEQEKFIADYEARQIEITGNCEKEKSIAQKVEADAEEIEKKIEAKKAETEATCAELQQRIDELNKLLQETIELTKDPEQLKTYEPPQLMEPEPTTDAFFLNEEILELAKEESGKKKKKKGKKKSARSKSPRAKSPKSKSPRSKSPKKSAKSTTRTEEPIEETQNDENISGNESPLESTLDSPQPTAKAEKKSKKGAKGGAKKRPASARRKSPPKRSKTSMK